MRGVIFLMLGVVCSGCDFQSDLAATDTPSILATCAGFSETGKTPVVQGAECGSLSVKENPEAADGPDISLNILRLPAINPTPKPDPVFIIAGGPGQSATGIAESLYPYFNELRKNRDIVFVDQRGTGKSHPLNCASLAHFQDPMGAENHQQKLRQAVAECIDQYAGHLAYYTTPYAVQDLDAVRQALGYAQINIWSVSYGTRVALAYMQRFPEASRTAVLDGVAPLALALPWYAEEDALAALIKINEQCQQNSECEQSYGDLLSKARALAQRFAAKPQDLQLLHPRTHAQMTVHMDQQSFVSIVRMALYMRDLSTLLPLMIARSYDGDYQLLGSLTTMVGEQSELLNVSFGMHYNVLCNEDYPQYRARDMARSQQFLGADLVAFTSEICAQWPRAPLPQSYLEKSEIDVPVLLLSGQRDPVTPPRWAELAMKDLRNARHVIAPGGHHSITREGCIAQLITQFIQHGTNASLETQCARDILPLSPYLEPAVKADSTEAAE